LIGWLVGWVVGWLAGWLIDLLIDGFEIRTVVCMYEGWKWVLRNGLL
jgi:uncharacterized membrane protein YvlD (DUF360 family)